MPATTSESLLLAAWLQRLPTTRYTCAFVLLLAGAYHRGFRHWQLVGHPADLEAADAF
jgi:hypothetical protein